MLKTRIFVSASGDSQKRDTLEIESFFRRISDCYVDRGHYFSLILGEDFGDTAVIGSEIADCTLAFFLTMPGAELPETYKTALNSYNKTGKPKVFVYTKSEGSGVRGQELGNGQLTTDNGQLTVDNGQLINSTLQTSNFKLQTSNFKLNF